MKKTFSLVVVLTLICSGATAWAIPWTDCTLAASNCTGPAGPNSSPPTETAAIVAIINMGHVLAAAPNDPLLVTDIMFLGRFDDDMDLYGSIDPPDAISNDLKAGTFTIPDFADFVAVKGGNGNVALKVWELDPAAKSGDWNTIGLLNNGNNQPGLSHISYWKKVDSVPIPSTLLFFGAGFAAFVGWRRYEDRKSVN